MNAIQNSFINDGKYENTFDESGNLLIVGNNEMYLSVILNQEVYDEKSLSAIYNLNIDEFKESAPTSNKKVESLESEKSNLQKQITNLTTQLSNVNTSDKDTLINASKDIIVSLRMKAGDGASVSEFNTAFPYLPLYSDAAKQSDASGISAQSTSSIPFSTNTSTPATTITDTLTLGQKVQSGDVCPRQEQIQLIPPTDILDAEGGLPVMSAGVNNAPTIDVTPTIPIHQAAVASVVSGPKPCKELFYSVRNRNWFFGSNNNRYDPMGVNYGIYSDRMTENFVDTSDTLPFQVYIPNDGTYTIKFSASNSGYIEMDNVKLIEFISDRARNQINSYRPSQDITKELTSGWKNVNIFYTNRGGPHLTSASISYRGVIIWTSRMAYNAKDYFDCSGNLPKFHTIINAVIDNPQGSGSTKLYSFDGQVDSKLRITLKGQTYVYSNEKSHGVLQKTSTFFGGGLNQSGSALTINKLEGRGTIKLTQQPSVLNDYTAIVDISDPPGDEDHYAFELN